jgi:hypothetical protein
MDVLINSIKSTDLNKRVNITLFYFINDTSKKVQYIIKEISTVVVAYIFY